jgi:hypothetical protein
MICSPHHILFEQIKNNEMGRACGTCGRQDRCVQGLVERSEGKRPLGRPKSRWEDNIKIDLQGMGWEGMVWNDLLQDMDR